MIRKFAALLIINLGWASSVYAQLTYTRGQAATGVWQVMAELSPTPNLSLIENLTISPGSLLIFPASFDKSPGDDTGKQRLVHDLGRQVPPVNEKKHGFVLLRRNYFTESKVAVADIMAIESSHLEFRDLPVSAIGDSPLSNYELLTQNMHRYAIRDGGGVSAYPTGHEGIDGGIRVRGAYLLKATSIAETIDVEVAPIEENKETRRLISSAGKAIAWNAGFSPSTLTEINRWSKKFLRGRLAVVLNSDVRNRTVWSGSLKVAILKDEAAKAFTLNMPTLFICGSPIHPDAIRAAEAWFATDHGKITHPYGSLQIPDGDRSLDASAMNIKAKNLATDYHLDEIDTK